MKPIDLATHRVNGGFFVLNGRTPQAYEWPHAAGGAYEIVGTYTKSGAPLRDVLVNMIREAREHVFLASFLLGDELVIGELLAAAQRLRGGVYVITALDERSLRRGLQEYDDESGQEPPEERRKNFERLTSNGVYVRGHEECHAKFAVVDRTTALVGSANFVTKGFEYTGELNVLVREPSQVQQARRFFVRLWYEGCNWEVPPGTVYTVAKRHPAATSTGPSDDDRSENRLVWTNGSTETNLLAAIREVIDASQHELLFSTYSITGMSQNPELVMEPLARAIRRGVSARLLIRQRNAYQWQMADLLAVHELGVQIHGDVRNHAKTVVTDRKLAAVFSANFDAVHGLNSGVEAGMRLGDPAAVERIARYLDHAMSNAETTYVVNPTLAELDGRLAARWIAPWPHHVVVSVPFGTPLFEALGRAGEPILYEQAADETLTVYVGGLALCVNSGDVTPSDVTATQRLQNWLESSRFAGKPCSKRGFCPATINWTSLT